MLIRYEKRKERSETRAGAIGTTRNLSVRRLTDPDSFKIPKQAETPKNESNDNQVGT